MAKRGGWPKGREVTAQTRRDSAPRLARWQEILAPLLVLLLLAGIIATRQPEFLSRGNLLNVAMRSVPLTLIAVGQAMVIIAGQIDLSVGSVMALAAVVSAIGLRENLPLPVALLAGIGVGGLCGAVNGWITTKAKVPSFVVTLAMMGLARGLALAITGGLTVSEAFALNDLVLTTWLGLPLPVWALLVVALAVHFALRQTVFGRHACATGANPVAARLSGVRTDRNIILCFTIAGLLVGLAGVIECGRNSSAAPTMGELMELDAIAAVVIGGASLSGGQGSVGGTLLGVAIMAVLRNGSNLLGISNEWEKVIIGPLIVIAVLYDRWLRRRRGAG